MTHPQNDPDRAGGLVSDAVGEFVAEEPGGAFDPRTFRGDRAGAPVERSTGTPASLNGPDDDTDVPAEQRRPPSDDERMSGPGEEIDKAG